MHDDLLTQDPPQPGLPPITAAGERRRGQGEGGRQKGKVLQG